MTTFRHHRYRVSRLLARAKTGLVHLGVDLGSGDQVVIKEVRLVGGQAADVDQFRAEVARVHDVSHGGLAEVRGLITDGPAAWLVTEFVEGKTLQDIVAQEGPFEEEQALHVALQVGNALQALHALRPPFIVRSLAPSDVVMDPDRQPRLIDVGIGKFLRVVGETAVLADDVLVAGQAAPEQLEGFADVRSDVYALGALLFFMLAGVRLAPEEVWEPMAALERRCPEVSERTRIVVASMLEADRLQRPPTVLAAMDALGMLDRPPPQEAAEEVEETPPEPEADLRPTRRMRVQPEPGPDSRPTRRMRVEPARAPQPRPAPKPRKRREPSRPLMVQLSHMQLPGLPTLPAIPTLPEIPWRAVGAVAVVVVMYFALHWLFRDESHVPPRMATTTSTAPIEASSVPVSQAGGDGPARGSGLAAVTVVSIPGSARVLLDGNDRGLTPITLQDIPIGMHHLRLESPGWAPLDYWLDLADGDHPSLTLPLPRAAGAPSGD